MIRKLARVVLVWLLLGGWISLSRAATYELLDGTSISGDFVSANAQGLIVKRSDGTLANRTGWTNFTQTALKELVKLPQAKKFAELLIEEEIAETESAAKKALEINVKMPPRVDRPDPHARLGALFSSPISVTLLLLVYLANLYAAYEVSVFRNQAPALVCGLAVVLPILTPIIFVCVPTRIPGADETEDFEGATEAPAPGPGLSVPHSGQAAAEAAPAHGAGHGAAGGHPPATVFQRGQFTFNRRFFETKLAGYLRMVPGEAERDMLLHFKSTRGEHVGSRISRVTPNEIQLQVNKGGASQDVMIPFAEITEIQIRHKDA